MNLINRLGILVVATALASALNGSQAADTEAQQPTIRKFPNTRLFQI